MATKRAINLRYKPIHPKPTPTPTPTPPKPKPRLGPLLFGGALLYVTATYVSMSVFKSKSDTTDRLSGKKDQDPVSPSNFDTTGVWDSVAKKYDKEIGWDEVVMGMGLLRRWLIGKAQVRTESTYLLFY